MVYVIYNECCNYFHYAECRFAECHYAECRYAECHDAECRYDECHYAECRGIQINASKAEICLVEHFA